LDPFYHAAQRWSAAWNPHRQDVEAYIYIALVPLSSMPMCMNFFWSLKVLFRQKTMEIAPTTPTNHTYYCLTNTVRHCILPSCRW
jgi:hypothetical protein